MGNCSIESSENNKLVWSKQQDNLYFVWLDEFNKVQSICLNGQQRTFFPSYYLIYRKKQTNVVLSVLFQLT